MPESDSTVKQVGVPAEHELSAEYQQTTSQDLSDISLPFTVEDVTLMSPGVWNDVEYMESEIKEAYRRTNWDDEDVRSMFNEHDDEDSRDWIGEVRNVRMEGNDMVGDVDLVTAEEARKVAYGARFGISPKVAGRKKNGRMRKYSYANFSLVLDPAVKTTFLNSEQKSNDDTNDRGIKNVTVKSKMSDQDNTVELSEEDQEQLSEIVSTVEEADVEDLAEIISPFMSHSSEELEPQIEEAMSENSDDEDSEEMGTHGDDEEEEMRDIESIAREAAQSAVAEMMGEMSDDDDGSDSGVDDSADQAEESMSVDEIADQVAAKVNEDIEEMSEDSDEGDDGSEAVAELKEELEDVKEQLRTENNSKSEEKTPNPGSTATGASQNKSPQKEVEEMSVEELDKGAAKHLLRKQERRV